MNVLVSLSYYLPNISGLTIYAKNLSEALVKRGHTVAILTSQHQRSLPLYETSQTLSIVRVPVSLHMGKAVFMLTYPWHAWRCVQKTDVVNCHLPQFESSLLAVFAKLLRKKFVITYHTDLQGAGIIFQCMKLILMLSQLVSGLLADAIVVQTKEYVNQSAFLQLFRRKLVFIYPPVAVSDYTRETQLRLKNMLPVEAYHIGVVSRIAREKGIDYLLDAIPKLESLLDKPFVIVFAGPADAVGESSYVERIRTRIEVYKERIIFLGKLSFEELAALYPLLQVLVLPSVNKTEAFGMVQIEAMLANVPVVATNLPGVRIPVQLTGMGKVVPIKNGDALAEAIASVLKHGGAYRKHATMVEKFFSPEQSILHYEKLFTMTHTR